ncbi:MAG: class I SAM-dependent methyltransferase [Spirochaetes bacterium]|jgi:SAM-dependent methyltransferase|nr:class I SAM-dependent methyltransferase [Spirochaetota bacterium]
MSTPPWNKHYDRDRSLLGYPDENLVRLLAEYTKNNFPENLNAIDIGSGSGRHVPLLQEFGFTSIVATDISENSARILKNYGIFSVQCSTSDSPFRDDSFDAAICWGSLHYDTEKGVNQQIQEIHRILKPGGFLFGTFRSEQDTYFNRKQKLSDHTWIVSLSDLDECTVTYADEKYLTSLFSEFNSFECGYMERTRLNTKAKIAHHYFRAVV